MTTGVEVEYRKVEQYPGYRFGSDGSVWTKRRLNRWHNVTDKWRKLDPYLDPNGYYATGVIGADGKSKHRMIHRLILEAFVGPRPPGMVCRHLNGDSKDNRIDNLAWGLPVQNSGDMVNHGRSTRGTKNPMSRLTEDQVIEIRRLYKPYDRKASMPVLAKRFGVCEATIKLIIKGRRWSWLTNEDNNAN